MPSPIAHTWIKLFCLPTHTQTKPCMEAGTQPKNEVCFTNTLWLKKYEERGGSRILQKMLFWESEELVFKKKTLINKIFVMTMALPHVTQTSIWNFVDERKSLWQEAVEIFFKVTLPRLMPPLYHPTQPRQELYSRSDMLKIPILDYLRKLSWTILDSWINSPRTSTN